MLNLLFKTVFKTLTVIFLVIAGVFGLLAFAESGDIGKYLVATAALTVVAFGIYGSLIHQTPR